MARRSATVTLWMLVVVLVLTALVAATGRLGAVLETRRTGLFPAPGSFDELYARHPVTTLLHIVPGTLFMLLGPLQFVPAVRRRFLDAHRWSGRLYVAASVLVAYSALRLVFTRPFGGPSEAAATVFFTAIFLFALGKAVIHILRREVELHREWMIRGFAVGLAIATIRPVVGVYVVLSDLAVAEILGTAFWLSFSSHLVAAELWINYTRRS